MSHPWVRSFVRGDLMRAIRLIFLLALAVTSLVLTVQVAQMGVGSAATTMCAAVLLASLVLRVIEIHEVRPAPIWVDAVEQTILFALLAQVTAVYPVISYFFMVLLCRATVGPLWRLILLQAGYLITWIVAAVAFPLIVAVPGAMISLPVVSLLVYCLRTLMLRVQQQQAAQNALLAGVLSELPVPVIVVGADGDVVLANPAVVDLIGWRGPAAPQLSDLRLTDAEERPIDVPGLLAGAAAPGLMDAQVVRDNGSARQVKVHTVPMAGGVVLALQDVTAQKMYQQHLHRAAYFDLLTGLPNRRMLFEQLQLAHSNDMPYALLLIDLNDFKAVNDTQGHQIGDELLAGVADRIRSAVDEAATVARLGGDEFAVLLPYVTVDEAEAAARAVRASFTEPIRLTTGPLAASGTVGVAVAGEGQTPDQVMERADAAMYELKPSSRRRHRNHERSQPTAAA